MKIGLEGSNSSVPGSRQAHFLPTPHCGGETKIIIQRAECNWRQNAEELRNRFPAKKI